MLAAHIDEKSAVQRDARRRKSNEQKAADADRVAPFCRGGASRERRSENRGVRWAIGRLKTRLTTTSRRVNAAFVQNTALAAAAFRIESAPTAGDDDEKAATT